MKSKKSSILLGLDPGTTRVGYGLIEKSPTHKLSLVACGLIRIEGENASLRLLSLNRELEKILRTHQPKSVSVESLFFSKNKKTALSVAEARGAILLSIERFGIPILEFTPSSVKSVVAGDGRCSKKALAKIVALTLGVENIPGPDDVSDALAVAIRGSFEPFQERGLT